VKGERFELMIFNLLHLIQNRFFFEMVFKRVLLGGSPRSVLLAFSQSYVEHDLRKNKIIIPFFC
jgi:hypothetical protein